MQHHIGMNSSFGNSKHSNTRKVFRGILFEGKIELDKEKLSNYRLAEDNEDDKEASADEPFEPYYITEEDT